LPFHRLENYGLATLLLSEVSSRKHPQVRQRFPDQAYAERTQKTLQEAKQQLQTLKPTLKKPFKVYKKRKQNY
jgi:hypothetical protein